MNQVDWGRKSNNEERQLMTKVDWRRKLIDEESRLTRLTKKVDGQWKFVDEDSQLTRWLLMTFDSSHESKRVNKNEIFEKN